MLSAMDFIYYINKSIATKVDSSYFGLLTNSTQRIMYCGERWASTRNV